MNKKILAVDDDIDILEPISLILESAGYTALTTSKGQKTFENIEKFKPDLVLLDILISGSDGREICRTIKKNSSTKNLPVVMMSARPDAVNDSNECGADDFIAKPFETDELVKVVKKNLK